MHKGKVAKNKGVLGPRERASTVEVGTPHKHKQAHIDDLRYVRDLGGVAEHTLPASALQCVLTLSMRWVETLYIPP